MAMCCRKILLTTPVVRTSLMAKTWYPTRLSGIYVNGKSYYKLTGIETHSKGVSLRWGD